MARKKTEAADAKPAPDDGQSGSALSFEDSLAELQGIVNRLEDGSLPLEESMLQFERGVSLLRTCHEVLSRAEQRIEILTGTNADETPSTAPFDAAATFDAASDSGRAPRRGARGDDSLF